MQAIKESGCIATMLATGRYSQPPDIHHLTSGGRRQGHMSTIGLSPWHHRGLKTNGLSNQQMSGIYGPSFVHGRRGFEEFFGTDWGLLQIQNLVLKHWVRNPWHNYVPHRDVCREAHQMWTKLNKEIK